MSKGPGKIERIIEAAFKHLSDQAFSVEELAALAYPEIHIVEKRHRVAVLRAADKVAARLGWTGIFSKTPGRPLIYANRANPRSIGVARLRSDEFYSLLPVLDIERLFDEPDIDPHMYAQTQPGGIYYQHALIYQLETQGRFAEMRKAQAELTAMIGDYRKRRVQLGLL